MASTHNKKPTVVIMPGTWHLPTAYNRLKTHLESTGYSVLIQRYPSLDSPDPTNATCGVDVEAARKQILLVIEEDGQDVIIICHSYGGIVGAGAAHGLSKSTRQAKGNPEGVLGLVFITAFVIPEQMSLGGYMSTFAGKGASYILKDQVLLKSASLHDPFLTLVVHQPTVGLCQTDRSVEVFYNDLDPADVEHILATVRPHAFNALDSPAPPQAWAETAFKGRLAFLRCTQDQALPISTQDTLMQKSGVDWLVKDVEGSHFALVSHVDDVTQAIIGWMELFLKV